MTEGGGDPPDESENMSYLLAGTDSTIAASSTTFSDNGDWLLAVAPLNDSVYGAAVYPIDIETVLILQRPSITAAMLEQLCTRMWNTQNSDGAVASGFYQDGEARFLGFQNHDTPRAIAAVYHQCRRAGSIALYNTLKMKLAAGLNCKGRNPDDSIVVQVVNHLVTIDSSAVNQSQGHNRGWGYLDSCYTDGNDLGCSCERYRAYQYMSRMAIAAGDTDVYAAELPLIRAAIVAALWNPTKKLLTWCDGTYYGNSQVAISGTAFALWCGALQGQEALDASAALVTRYKNGEFTHGCATLLAADEEWNTPSDGATEQGHDLWPRHTGWLWAAMALTDVEAAEQAQNDYVTYLKTGGYAYESIAPNGAPYGSHNYGEAWANPAGFGYVDPGIVLVS